MNNRDILLKQNVHRYRNLKTVQTPEAPFLGLFTGKKKQREAEAKIKVIEAQTAADLKLKEQENQRLLLQLEAAKQGYKPEEKAAEQAIQLEQVKQGSEKTLYYVLAAVVGIVIIGIYLLKKK